MAGVKIMLGRVSAFKRGLARAQTPRLYMVAGSVRARHGGKLGPAIKLFRKELNKLIGTSGVGDVYIGICVTNVAQAKN